MPKVLREQKEAKVLGEKQELLARLVIKEKGDHQGLLATQEVLETKVTKAIREMMVRQEQREKGEEWEFLVSVDKSAQGDLEENVVEQEVKAFLVPKEILVSQDHPGQ